MVDLIQILVFLFHQVAELLSDRLEFIGGQVLHHS